MTTRLEAQPVIGLEVHAQLLTKSKMFCGCSAAYADSQPNTQVCPVCSGMPGSLPVINREAVEDTLATALALHCEVPTRSKFDRKNYQYPDIPKGFQISQYDMPIGVRGWLEYSVGDERLRCGITRVHLEEDTGKSFHTASDGREVSLLDYNRSGVPLMEIVTEPELHSPEAAKEFFVTLRQLLMYLDVNDGKLQEGSMRADVNVSVRRSDGSLGDKVEIKNLNSFRAVEHALRYEVQRQAEILASGGAIVQETRGWSEKEEITVSQRSKEYAQDYRYFPEPDLPALVITRAHVDRVLSSLPEAPVARLERFQAQYSLSPYAARLLTDEKPMADFYETAVQSAPTVQPTTIANWVTGDLARLLNESGRSVESTGVTPASLGRLLSLVQDGTVSGAAGKRVLEDIFISGEQPDIVVEREGLRQIVDPEAIESIVDGVLAANEPLVAAYRKGKTNAIQALVGQVMKASRGSANPALARSTLERKLADASE